MADAFLRPSSVIDERPVAIEEGPLDVAVDEMLQHGEDVREGGGVSLEWSEAGLLERVQIVVRSPSLGTRVERRTSASYPPPGR